MNCRNANFVITCVYIFFKKYFQEVQKGFDVINKTNYLANYTKINNLLL